MTNAHGEVLEATRHGIGGNNPPPPTLEERLREAAADLLKSRDETYLPVAARWDAERPKIIDEGGAQVGTEFVKRTGDLLRQFEALRVAEKEPFLRDSRVVDSTFKAFTTPLLEASNAVRRKLDTYMAEQKRKADAEAKRLRDLAEAERKAAAESGQAAPASAPVIQSAPIQTRSAGGALASARTVWKWRCTDLAAVPRAYMQLNETAINGAISGGLRELPGIEIYEETKATIR
jgi:hypothetical protein